MEIPGQEHCSQEKKRCTQRFNYDYLTKAVLIEGKHMYGPHFEIATLDLPVIHSLLAYVLGDEDLMIQKQIDKHKGIMLAGKIGCGKSALLHILRRLVPESFDPIIKSCREIVTEFPGNERQTIARYSKNSILPHTSISRPYCFDDLGCESPVSYRGVLWNVMREIIAARYELYMSNKMITHVITNLNAEELESVYGKAIRSRMRSMFNLIAFDSNTTDKRI